MLSETAAIDPRTNEALRTEIAELHAFCSAHVLSDSEACIAKARAAYELAEKLEDDVLLGRSLYWIALGLRQNADILSASQLIRQALELLERAGDQEYVARALQACGAMRSVSGEFEQAVQCFEKALVIARARNDAFTIQRILNSWGIVYIRIADYTHALELFSECLSLLETSPEPYMQSSILLNIAGIYQRTGDYATSIDYCEQSLAVEGRTDDDRHNCSALLMRADSLCKLGRVEEARESFERVLEIAKTRDFADLEALSYKGLGETSVQEGQDRESIDSLERAVELLEVTGNTLYLTKAELQLGIMVTKIGDKERGELLLQRALHSAERANSPQILVETHEALADYYEGIGNTLKAAMHLREALKQNFVLQSESNNRAVRDMERRMAIQAAMREAEIERTRAAELQAANDALALLSERQAEILSVVSHDMSNPIVAIIGIADLMRTNDKLTVEEARRCFKMIQESGEQLLSLVRQLLLASQLESGAITIEPKPVDFGEVLSKCVTLVRPVASQKEIGLHLELDLDRRLYEIDRDNFAHILNNILSNAVKFTHRGGSVDVISGYDKARGQLMVTVRDSGVGIDYEQMPEIFRKFTPARRNGTAHEQGNGMGLAIVKQLIELMAGEIAVDSKPGKGTTVTLRIPAKEA